MRILLDANVLIAAFVARGLSSELLEYCVRRHELVTSEAILDEVRRNLVAKVRASTVHARQTVQLLRTRHRLVEPARLTARVCRDASDDVVLGTALAGECNAIVTGDRDLLELGSYVGVPILSPRGFWSFEARRRKG